MPTKKASKKTQKKSGKKISKRGTRKSASRKAGGKKGATKKSATSAKASKKATAKGGSRKAATKKGMTRGGKKRATGVTTKSRKAGAKASAAATAVLKGNCLGLAEAGAIVESAVVAVGGISLGSYDVDKRLEQMGVITANQCTIVKQRILNDVRSFPCDIDDGDVTCTPGTVARAIRDQVRDNSSRP